MAPITRPRYSVSKNYTDVKYKKQKATDMLNFARTTRIGTNFDIEVITDTIRSRQESVQTTYEVMNPFLMFSTLTMK